MYWACMLLHAVPQHDELLMQPSPSAGDIKKAKEGGVHTCEALVMSTKKVKQQRACRAVHLSSIMHTCICLTCCTPPLHDDAAVVDGVGPGHLPSVKGIQTTGSALLSPGHYHTQTGAKRCASKPHMVCSCSNWPPSRGSQRQRSTKWWTLPRSCAQTALAGAALHLWNSRSAPLECMHM